MGLLRAIHREVYRSAAAHGEPYLQVGMPPQACFVDESGDRGGKATLVHFSSFVRRLPISYITFVYRRSQFEDPTRLMERMGRDISSAMVEHLDFFQSFDDVKVYYDNGQDIVKQALDRSADKALSGGVVRRRKTSMTDYRLEQVADYLCTIELALVKYEAKGNGETYNKLFGGVGSFKRNWLKQARGKRI